MAAQRRVRAAGFVVTLVLLAAARATAQAPAGPATNAADPMASEAMRADAWLADVAFVDAEFGWAVGERGTIWHTEDGGRQWQLQASPVTCPLASVCFLDRNTGWAAGGTAHPYTHTGSGVVLVTRDGGRTWSFDRKLLLPPLKKIGFFDAKNGWAVGTASAMFPSGVFLTSDGGRSWQPVPGEKSPGWLAGDFLAADNGALAGRQGAASVVRGGEIAKSQAAPQGLRSISRMTLVAPQYGWIVGEGGLVMMTADLGLSWQTPPGEVPPPLAAQFDFAALAVRGPKAWIAGAPGTRVLHTADAGQTWEPLATGQTLPISALTFVDDQRGWAVGALGTILATSDGGRTWQRQRAGGSRAALLGMFGQTSDVPFEALAQVCGDEAYLGIVDVLNRRDVETPERSEVPAADRLREAVASVGASGALAAWQFPLRQPGMKLSLEQIVAGWDLTNDGRGLIEFERHLTAQIRTWRPEIILTHDADVYGRDPLGGVLHQAVLRAVDQAAEPLAFPEQLTAAGLEPWRVKKVFATLPPGVNGVVNITPAALAERLGRALAEVAAGPRGLICERFEPSPPTLGFRLVRNQLEEPAERAGFFTLIPLSPGGDARRAWIEASAGSADLARRVAQKRRNVEAILERGRQDPQGGLTLLSHAHELTRDMDRETAAGVLYQMADRYYRSGRWEQAAESFQIVVDRYADLPLARPAAAWLVAYHTSGEAAWRGGRANEFASTNAAWHAEAADKAGVAGSGGRRAAEVRQLSFDVPGVESEGETTTQPADARFDGAAAIGGWLEQNRPALFAQPAVGFALAAMDRQRGYPRQAERFYLARRTSATHDAWWACAQGEHWLTQPMSGNCPKPILHCAYAAGKPRLDGRLDEAVWQAARPAELKSTLGDDAPWPAVALVARDDDFFYLAVAARKAPGADYTPTQGTRPRDPDLSGRDRVEFLIDIDRDYGTYYRLAVDDRGWTGESCWGDGTWDPQWFVAANSDAQTWTAEAAIPIEELTGRRPVPRDVWAVGVQRIAPGAGFQSWNQPAAAEVAPEGFGYLLFD